MIDDDTSPGEITESKIRDLSVLDRTRLGPNGEKPWEPTPAPTIEWLEYQYKLAAKNRAVIDINGQVTDVSEVIGKYREITPCPSKGKISFKQIGDLREYSRQEISMDDEELLICRKPVASGGLDNKDNPIYEHADPTYDPKDFYSAFYGHFYDVYRAKILPMNPLRAWNEGFSSPHPLDNKQENNGYGYRGVQVKENDAGKYFRLYSASVGEYVFVGWYPNNTPAYDWRYYPKATYCTAYVGRIPAGTRLEYSVQIYKPYGDWRSEGGSFQIRGWSEGFFGGESMDYVNNYFGGAGSSSAFQTFSGEFTIDDRFQDLWMAFQQNGSNNSNHYQNIYFRNFQIWRV